MNEKTKLEEMSSELPEKERKELLAKITRKMHSGEREEIVRVELKKEERERLIAEEMLQISGWVRFILWLKSFFSGKSMRELFINLKLNQLKRIIKQRNPGISGFETRNLTPKFAREIFDLYAAVFPLHDLYQAFTRDEEFRDGAMSYLFEVKYDDARKDVEEMVSLEEMENVYAESGLEDEVKKQILRRYNEYLRKIPEKLFTQLEEGMKPIIYLKNLVLFPFSAIFRHFNYFLGDRLDEKYPYFDHAPAMLMLDQLERLYYTVYLSEKLNTDWFCHEEFFHYYCLHKREVEEADELDSQEIGQEVSELTGDLTILVEAAKHFNKKVPMLELMRYFQKDPYYRLVFNIPRFHIRAIYASALKERLLDQFDEKMTVVKKNVVERMIKETFKTDQLLELFYYNDKPNFDFRKLELPYFTYTKSLMILYNYLLRIYKGYIQEVIQLAGTYLLSSNRITQNRLMQCAAGLEELEAKIVLLDRSLSPEEDDGKTLMRYRHRISTDIAKQKIYRSFIIQKDREAEELIDRGKECLLGIKKIFDEIITSPMESIKSILKTLHFHRGKNQTLMYLLKYASEIIADFHDLMDQLLMTEKGS